MKIARRAVPLELRMDDDTPAGVIEGYGAVFGNIDSYGDAIAKGAFKETLRDHKKAKTMPALLQQHGGWGIGSDDLMPIGVWTEMAEDDHGLFVRGQLALDTQRGKDAYALLKMKPRPALNGLSIGFVAKSWDNGTKPEEPRRTLKKVELWEVSLVTFPANDKARLDGVKGIKTVRDFEDFLREAGFSAGAAKGIAANGFRPIEEGAGVSDLSEIVDLARKRWTFPTAA